MPLREGHVDGRGSGDDAEVRVVILVLPGLGISKADSVVWIQNETKREGGLLWGERARERERERMVPRRSKRPSGLRRQRVAQPGCPATRPAPGLRVRHSVTS